MDFSLRAALRGKPINAETLEKLGEEVSLACGTVLCFALCILHYCYLHHCFNSLLSAYSSTSADCQLLTCSNSTAGS